MRGLCLLSIVLVIMAAAIAATPAEARPACPCVGAACAIVAPAAPLKAPTGPVVFKPDQAKHKPDQVAIHEPTVYEHHAHRGPVRSTVRAVGRGLVLLLRPVGRLFCWRH